MTSQLNNAGYYKLSINNIRASNLRSLRFKNQNPTISIDIGEDKKQTKCIEGSKTNFDFIDENFEYIFLKSKFEELNVSNF